ncbi:MAG: hypothetical protein DELT_02217 [Desulfovibrio sp.]
MSDIKLFRFSNDKAEELAGRSALVERELHDLMEKHMECFLGIRFVAHEYSTGKSHGGRIDSLGLDENFCPVIIEYKRQSNENVINQGLYYLNWLLDHQAEFKLLVMERFDKDVADAIEWTGTRVLCVAGDFTKFDEHAVAQIGRNIELIRYKYFSNDLLMLEWVNPVAATIRNSKKRVESSSPHDQSPSPSGWEELFEKRLAQQPEGMQSLFMEIYDYILSISDDVNVKQLKLYTAFTRLKNFVCLMMYKKDFKLWLKLNPDTVTLENGFSDDMRGKGHWGTGELRLTIRNKEDFIKAKPLIERAYQEN